jgi:hypothetical protein
MKTDFAPVSVISNISLPRSEKMMSETMGTTKTSLIT